MARYIDADRLIFADGGNNNRNFDFVLRMQIDNAETVDAVPVVRCKDCAKGSTTTEQADLIMCYRLNCLMLDDGWCCYGERKGEVSE